MKRLGVTLGLIAVLITASGPSVRDAWRVGNLSPYGWLFGGQPLVAAYIPYLIKSIQRGTITATGTSGAAVVTAVVVANSDLRYLGNTYTTAAATAEDSMLAYLTLTDTTHVTAVRTSGTGSVIVGYELLEYYTGVVKSRQAGQITSTGPGTYTATITAVNMARTEMGRLGVATNTSSGFGVDYLGAVALTNSTTVTASRGSNAGTIVFGYQVLERFR